MPREQQSNKSAQILYMPIGIVTSLLAGLVARRIFQVVWKHATPGDEEDAPTPLESDYDFREILVAAAIQGVVFSLVKAVVRRGGARAFQKWTGDWPGH
jgi:uncharacterized protein DUF4235